MKSQRREIASCEVDDNLFHETRELCAASFLIYVLTHFPLPQRSRTKLSHNEGDRNPPPNPCSPTSVHDFDLVVSETNNVSAWTPTEVKNWIESVIVDQPMRRKRFTDQERKSLEMLEALSRKADPKVERPLELVDFDNEYQHKELVYALCKDSVRNRITVVFRGTDNFVARQTNWSANLNIKKSKINVPEPLSREVKTCKFRLHSGFYNYLFKPTEDKNDAKTTRIYDKILDQANVLLKKHPGYKLYVTGHSLGGALSTIAAFYFACERDIPKPVTCINFAAPRVGDANFRSATQALEKQGQLRLLRVVNDNDNVTAMPCINYKHVGFQLRLYRNSKKQPELIYPRVNGTSLERARRTWGNSVLTGMNASDDHGDYRERVELARTYMEKLDWDSLYSNQDLLGFVTQKA